MPAALVGFFFIRKEVKRQQNMAPKCKYSYDPKTRRCRSKQQHERNARASPRRKCTYSRSPSGKCRSRVEHARATRGKPKPALVAPGHIVKPYVKFAEFDDLLRMLESSELEQVIANIEDLSDFLARLTTCLKKSKNNVRGCAENLARQGVGIDPYVAQVNWIQMAMTAAMTPRS